MKVEDQTKEEELAPSQPPKPEVGATGRTHAVTHPISEAPLCAQCQDLQLVFFDPCCPGCWSLAQDPQTTVGELFAILRQWVPQVQQRVLDIGQEIFQRDFQVDDRDGLTDMTLLHYATKAGCEGIGDGNSALKLVTLLLDSGATPDLRCRWTHMAALHYAAFFDVVQVIQLLLDVTQFKDLESKCSEFDDGTPLHIAASNGCLEAARCLLQLGANSHAKDSRGRVPLLCVPDSTDVTVARPGWEATAARLRQLLHPDSQFTRPRYAPQSYEDVPSKVLLASQGLGLGDRVCVGEAKSGTLRFYGVTQFAPGLWVGIELDEALGKHNGTVDGVEYFHCPPNHGIFAPLSKVSKFGSSPRPSTPKLGSGITLPVDHGRIDISHVSPKVDTGLRARTPVSSRPNDINVGDRVTLAGQVPRHGTVRYSGVTQFAAGWWYGIELDKPHGKNDGSVGGIRYFTCNPQHGVFTHFSKLTRCNQVSQDASDSSVSGPSSETNSTKNT